MEYSEYQYGKCENHLFQKILNASSQGGWKLVHFSTVRVSNWNWTEIHYVFEKKFVKMDNQ